ncbi:hypothetical protein BDP27DRAFT_1436049 [Rhodocollybia butyracea]|uniref:Uncharacterized protein n=1 Tax=Rhodocollybia butyracea TaxID=206335 RepID=A0A9P5P4W8_9AGAR|nr:hypothetical protein BDP27DRAFT_1436049 [Rhodocollybia butyracea]
MLAVYQTVHWLKHDGSGLGWTDEDGDCVTVTTPEDEAVWAGIVILALMLGRSRVWDGRFMTGWPNSNQIKLRALMCTDLHKTEVDENETQSVPRAPSRSGSVDWDESQMNHDLSGSSGAQRDIDPALKEALIAPLPTQTPVSLKQSHDSIGSASSQRRVRISAGEALKDLGGAVDRFGDRLVSATDNLRPGGSQHGLQPSPARRMGAIKVCWQQGDLAHSLQAGTSRQHAGSTTPVTQCTRKWQVAHQRLCHILMFQSPGALTRAPGREKHGVKPPTLLYTVWMACLQFFNPSMP